MRMLKKLALAIPCVLGLGFAFGMSANIIYAKIIPGVDEPYDPANYWSLDSISWADSAPSTYALRDLSSGRLVYDKRRHEESIKTSENFIEQLKILLQQVGILQDETMKFSAGTTRQMQQDREALTEAVFSGNTEIALDYDPSSPYYHEPGEAGYLDIKLENREAEQLKYMDEKFRNSAEYLRKSNETANDILEALEYAVNASDNAVGMNQILQAQNQIGALHNIAKVQRNEILGELNKIMALKKQQEEENWRMGAAMMDGKFSFGVADPNDPEQKKMIDGYYQVTGEKPYESKPMPNFAR